MNQEELGKKKFQAIFSLGIGWAFLSALIGYLDTISFWIIVGAMAGTTIWISIRIREIKRELKNNGKA